MSRDVDHLRTQLTIVHSPLMSITCGKNAVRCVTIATILYASFGCLTATTLSSDATHWFKIDWEAVSRPDGTVRLEGFIENTYGTAARVRLLAQALEPSGKVIAQKLWWLDTIPGFGRVSYRIPGLPHADRYTVTVWSYTRIESDDHIFFPHR